ncbi:hypothetical protein [Sphingomonas sp. SAFR-052]|uniref:hypothetical protein n=1 Tax=Sphingomonas sp. SAFR-052 TaxID=3436867 RepID=UPI003F80D9C9
MQIDLNAFADYALATFDFNEQFEDDAFSVQFEGFRVYVERKHSHFLLHIGTERHQLPR